MIKIFFASAATFFLFLPTMVGAQIDARCFTESECADLSGFYSGAGLSLGDSVSSRFYQGALASEACGATMFDASGTEQPAGFCQVIGGAKTKVRVADRTDFANVAEYIAYIYRYSMITAIVIAIIMVIGSGLRWILAGGESTKIESAKKRIGGAIIGLILLATSYTVLNTVNPALIELRLPQTWLIKPQQLGFWCEDITNQLARFSEAIPGPQGELSPPPANNLYTTERQDTRCGNQYYFTNSGSQTCQSRNCGIPSPNTDLSQTLVCAQERRQNATPACRRTNIAGNVYHTGALENQSGLFMGLSRWAIGEEGWEWPWLAGGDMKLAAVCSKGDGSAETISIKTRDINEILLPDETAHNQFFQIPLTVDDLLRLGEECWDDGERSVKGFVLEFGFGELEYEVGVLTMAGVEAVEEHYIGKNGGRGIDLGNVSADPEFKNCLMSLVDVRYLISRQDLLDGINIDIDLLDVLDIDDETENRQWYYTYPRITNVDESSWVQCLHNQEIEVPNEMEMRRIDELLRQMDTSVSG